MRPFSHHLNQPDGISCHSEPQCVPRTGVRSHGHRARPAMHHATVPETVSFVLDSSAGRRNANQLATAWILGESESARVASHRSSAMTPSRDRRTIYTRDLATLHRTRSDAMRTYTPNHSIPCSTPTRFVIPQVFPEKSFRRPHPPPFECRIRLEINQCDSRLCALPRSFCRRWSDNRTAL